MWSISKIRLLKNRLSVVRKSIRQPIDADGFYNEKRVQLRVEQLNKKA